MKYLYCLAFAAICANPVAAQDTPAEPAEPVATPHPAPRPVMRVVPAPPKSSHPDGPRAARPKNNWYIRLESGDYPPQAYANGEEGAVNYALTIDASGNATDCKVVESSGSSVLDETTCKIALAQNEGFEPALDYQAKPMADVYQDQLRWRIRKPELQTMLVEVSMRHNRDGSITNCELIRAEGEVFPELKREDPCKNMGRTGDVYRDENGVPVTKNVKVTMQVEVTDPVGETAE